MVSLSGKYFTKIFVLNYAYTKDRRAYWNCLCSCGNKLIIRGSSLTSKNTTSCGCIQRSRAADNLQNLSGKLFGELTVISRAPNKNKNKNTFWLCKCNCGKTVVVNAASLKRGATKSCGHLKFKSASETLFLDGLEKILGRNIKRQFVLHTNTGSRRYYDGYLTNTNIIIEVDGARWHSSEERLKNDSFKEKLATINNYKVVRFKVNNLSEVSSALGLVTEDFLKNKGFYD